MTYIVSIESVEVTSGIVHINLLYSDGADTFSEQLRTASAQPDEWLADQLRDRLAALNGLDAFTKKIPAGVIDPGSAPEPPPPKPEDVALITYAQLYDKYQRMRKAIDAGLIAEDDADYVATVTRLKRDFAPEFLPVIR